MKKIILIIAIAIISFFQSAEAKWYIDKAYKFKINVPASWSSNSFRDGTDKVYDFYSPDENIAIQLRTFAANNKVTTELLAQVYEENMLPAGTKKEELFDKVSKNGIPGKQGIYTSVYNGTDVTMSAFYAVPNDYGYVLLVIVPTNMIQEKTPEIQEITKTFFVDGFSAEPQMADEKPRSPGIGGSIGGKVNLNKQIQPPVSGNIAGRYEFYSRSDGKSLVEYHNITINDNGTYSEKYKPRNSGNYIGGQNGTWRKQGNQLFLTHQGGNITDTYTIKGNTITRTSSNGVTFTFGKI